MAHGIEPGFGVDDAAAGDDDIEGAIGRARRRLRQMRAYGENDR
jgi:hypothetical protein